LLLRPGFFAAGIERRLASPASFGRAPMPAFPWIVITYFVFVLFGFYLLYVYEPISTHYLFSWIFNPLI
jgi:hypothetical protein